MCWTEDWKTLGDSGWPCRLLSAADTHLGPLPFLCRRVRRGRLQTLHRKLLASLLHVVPEATGKGRS